MLNIASFTFNAFQENTYLVFNEKNECWIVDPGMYAPEEVTQLIAFLTQKKLHPQAIINTHAHIDHIFGIHPLIDKYHIPFGLHELELPILNIAAAAAAAFGFDYGKPPKPTFFIMESQPLRLGDDVLQVSHVPGHSPGSIAFYYEPGKWVISGDTLFAESIGRTDLPGGNMDELLAAIHNHLLTLHGETTVYSGHGPTTTIEHERRYNGFLR